MVKLKIFNIICNIFFPCSNCRDICFHSPALMFKNICLHNAAILHPLSPPRKDIHSSVKILRGLGLPERRTMANNITHTTRVLELSLALVQRFSHRIEIRKNEKSALNGSFLLSKWGIFEEGDFRFQTISTSGVKLKQRNIASLWGKLKHKKGSGSE